MPRSGDGVWTDIPNITAVPGQVIESADWNNYRADLRDNEFNAARPITAGGTGATNAADALANLGGVGVDNFLNAYPIGSFFGSVNDLDATWLRRNGGLYDIADYPVLGAILPALPDGIILTQATTSTTNLILHLAYGGGVYVAVGASATLLRSTDRLNWTPRDPDTTGTIGGVTYGASIFVAIASNGSVTKSPNAEVWSSSSVSGITAGQGITHDGTNFIVIGNNSGNPRASYSVDANSWTTVTPSGVIPAVDIAANSSVVVIVGSGGYIASSSDHGATWTTRTSGTANSLNGVCWDATTSLFIAVGASGTIRTSPDGINWTGRTSGASATLNSVSGSPQGIVVVGDSGTVVLSLNGTTYTLATSGSGVSFTYALADQNVASHYVISGGGGYIADGVRTLPTQFRVPNDDPDYGWIKALEELP